jgi:ESCRT-II complex subunit VPS22
MRRGKGIAAISQKQRIEEKLKEQGDKIEEDKLIKTQEEMKIFKENLELFAAKYKDKINTNPAFRKQFNDMCKSIGVDPLKSRKGFWAELLGVGDFYYELGVQIIEICMQSRDLNGGFMEMDTIVSQLTQKRGIQAEVITSNDVERAIQKLSILGSGFSILTIANRQIVQSVSVELSCDHTTIMGLAQSNGGYFSFEYAKQELKWNKERIYLSIKFLLQEGMVWLDTQDSTHQNLYWFPSIALLDY